MKSVDWANRFDTLSVSEVGAVRIVKMNRPDERNAADAVMHRELADIWAVLAEDPGCNAVILTGAGRAFSAGGDLPRMVATQQDQSIQDEVFAEARRTVLGMVDLPQPLIAAVNGPAVGLGASLVSLCDMAIASDRAFLADPHLGIGLVPADGAALLWPTMMGPMRAKRYVFTGERIPADEAVRLGLLNEVVPPDQVMPAALELATKLCEIPAVALRDTKRLMSAHATRALRDVLDDALSRERVSVNSADHLLLTRKLVGTNSQVDTRRSARDIAPEGLR
ncbi:MULTISPECIES: enoyl-CoA hydratase/isomerase family protein [Rhodococcus]|uniref:Enoyl-CoA hydratase/isomerase family protein n=1 Tax=Rhodococcus oxybenzonivorans TaxID=1990687 RepID=A0AAE5A710_9NOCA|nr:MULTISPECIES: enoyl-CoA hydratase/isomerase family protein [Rhodococcus]MDV7240572.1 enoyl-CoA hydratase/isomerase family protein [Rhodococcus oxybenzonivorans]MDV7265733.1 enoyl-CoA hydratase/isomerase family protein [Rhodococcus oxybenzonivorans]MDV7272845.1 enoyl-CoA hydratase/isomerase family protein [Rhodococcus oxybenzonivorans]MDV7333416.1 enoyl-CoA hydratase/isomerase family protein [Rhodococcus oxybenzonivorans]MDV7342583.1 enoyl-CoA hydratase/isomerase family protein [Rhodococcus 